MIGYNEEKEAMNTLELLLKSRQFIPLFNMSDAQIATSCGLKDSGEKEMAYLRVRWYAGLAFAIRDMNRSGSYAQCFSSADKAVRQPYDLLSRLDPLPAEEAAYQEAEAAFRQMQAEAAKQNPEQTPEQLEELSLEPTIGVKGFRWLRDVYLADLPEEEKKRARILYDRLLRIQPMRTLLSRLMALAKVLENTQTPGSDVTNAMDIQLSPKAEERLNELLSSIRAQIPSWQERKKKALLDVRGHDFTILDRLMDNWDKRLRCEEQFALPADLLFTVGHVPTLLTAAIVHKVAPAEPLLPIAASAGDQMDEGTIGRVRRQYCAIPGGHSLLGIYDEREGSAPDKFFRGVADRQIKEKKLRVMRVRGYAGLKLVQLTDDAEKKLNSAVFAEANVGKRVTQEESFCALDNGGRQLARMMSLELEKKRREMDGEECLLDLVKGEEQTDAQRVMAIRRLKEDVAAYFAENKIHKNTTGLLTPVGNKKNLHVRVVGRLMACMTDGLGIMSCPEKKVPDEVSRYLEKLLEDETARKAFAEQVKALQNRRKHLNMCFSGEGANRFLRVWSYPETEFQPVRMWLAAADQVESCDKLQQPDFTAMMLRDCCIRGLKKFIYQGEKIKDIEAPFPLAVEKIMEADTCFRLVCLWFKLRYGVLSPGKKIILICNEKTPEESCFVVGNERFSFVDMIATDDTETDGSKLSPESLRKNLASLRNQTFGVQKKRSKVKAVPPYSEFVIR